MTAGVDLLVDLPLSSGGHITSQTASRKQALADLPEKSRDWNYSTDHSEHVGLPTSWNNMQAENNTNEDEDEFYLFFSPFVVAAILRRGAVSEYGHR